MPNEAPQPSNSQFVLYQDDNGITNVNVRFDGGDVWLSQQQIALLFDTSRKNIVQHIRNIYQEAELGEEGTCKNILQVQTEGKRSVKRNIPNYNLDNILSVGNRPLLDNAGTVSHKQAIEKAAQEFEAYRRKEMLQYESDFDRAIKELKEQADNNKSTP